jgi:hypothetical protein
MAKQKLKAYELRRFYTMSMVLIPSILLVVSSMAITNFLARLLAQLLLFVLQVLVTKGITDDLVQEY